MWGQGQDPSSAGAGAGVPGPPGVPTGLPMDPLSLPQWAEGQGPGHTSLTFGLFSVLWPKVQPNLTLITHTCRLHKYLITHS